MIGSGRVGIWTTSWNNYSAHTVGQQLLGLGFSNHYELTNMYNPITERGHQSVDPHNDYLTIMYQAGPLAAVAYIGMQIMGVRYAFKLLHTDASRVIKQIALITIAMTPAAFFANSISNSFVTRTTIGWYFWTLVGIVMASYWATQRQKELSLNDQPSCNTTSKLSSLDYSQESV